MPSSGGVVGDSNAPGRRELRGSAEPGRMIRLRKNGQACEFRSGFFTSCLCFCLNFATASGGRIKIRPKQQLFTVFFEMFTNNFCFGKLFMILFTSCLQVVSVIVNTPINVAGRPSWLGRSTTTTTIAMRRQSLNQLQRAIPLLQVTME
jgi:hypothetical protein